MDWIACKKNSLVKEIKIDIHLMNSLLVTSSKKLLSQSLLELNEDTAISKVSLTYDALREVLEAIAISKGYKVYNHECYCSFLKEILLVSSWGNSFDDFRKIRNAINYYGKDITPVEADKMIAGMQTLIKALKEKFLKDDKKG